MFWAREKVTERIRNVQPQSPGGDAWPEAIRGHAAPKPQQDERTYEPAPAQPAAKSTAPTDTRVSEPAQGTEIEPDRVDHGPATKRRTGNDDKEKEDANNSTTPIKTIRPEEQNNSMPELFDPDKPPPQGDSEEFKKIGKIAGRQRRYDELGAGDIEPIRELFLLRYLTGKHWPGLSADMQNYYEKFYFTKPKKGSKDYAKHIKCWERRTRWIAERTSP